MRIPPPPTWQEMIGSLPPGQQAEMGALLADCGGPVAGEPAAAENNDTT